MSSGRWSVVRDVSNVVSGPQGWPGAPLRKSCWFGGFEEGIGNIKQNNMKLSVESNL